MCFQIVGHLFAPLVLFVELYNDKVLSSPKFIFMNLHRLNHYLVY